MAKRDIIGRESELCLMENSPTKQVQVTIIDLPSPSFTTHPFLLTYLSHFLSGLNYHQKMWCLNRKQLLTSKNYWNKENKNKIKNLRGRGKRHFNTGKKILLRHSYSSYERRGLEAIFDPQKKKKKKKEEKRK